MREDELQVSSSKFRAYAELLRLPNVFTAIADVMMGYLAALSTVYPVELLLLLIGISACLYLAGMIFNDLFDREIDAVERPERPIPSERVSVGEARLLGSTLLCVGLALAGYVSWKLGSAMPFVVAGTLAALAILYDKWLKHTPLSPLAMGGCRALNVLLGMSAAGWPPRPLEWFFVAGVGVYVSGLTVFARHEAGTSGRLRLIGGLVIMLGGMALIACMPKFVQDWRLNGLHERWPLFWALLAAHLIWRCGRAIVSLEPKQVRIAVTNAIMSIIVIDAAASLATAAVPIFSFSILVLIVPATLLGRWIYST